MVMKDFAILTPVPLEHLQSGADIAHKARFVTTGQYTSDNQGHWAALGHVCDLHELPAGKRLPISAIQTVKGGWRKTAPPRGPELVATRPMLELQL